MQKLTEQELTNVRELVNQFNTLKIQLGDAYIAQQMIMKKIDEVKVSYSAMEEELVSVYGQEATINIETGEVTIPEN
jgi:allophanate hydrolase subunit 1